MKVALTLFITTNSIFLFAQISNCSFSNWETITGLGQAYEIPTDWITNNERLTDGFATTPVVKINTDDGFLAKIESNYRSIDSYTKGVLSQKFSVMNIKSVSYESQCDSIYKKGGCVVYISTDDDSEILYADTITVTGEELKFESIEIASNWINQYDSLTIHFVADGQIFDLEPENNGHSIFLIDNVKTELISNTENISKKINISPNPVNNVLFFEGLSKGSSLIIYNIFGQTVFQEVVFEDNIQTSTNHWANGVYFVHVFGGEYNVHGYKILKE